MQSTIDKDTPDYWLEKLAKHSNFLYTYCPISVYSVYYTLEENRNGERT